MQFMIATVTPLLPVHFYTFCIGSRSENGKCQANKNEALHREVDADELNVNGIYLAVYIHELLHHHV